DLEKALVEKVEKLRKVLATLELQIRDLLPEVRGKDEVWNLHSIGFRGKELRRH
ncbi:hypothetical protein Pmar_PMAR027372, partial [Perkinsus marinus ATCC 50983]